MSSIMAENADFCGQIECVRGIYAKAVITMEPDEPVIIGRSPDEANLVIGSQRVSRVHCAIRYNAEDGKYYVIDYSLNGTYLGDGTRLEKDVQTELPSGTVIFVADTDNMFRLL